MRNFYQKNILSYDEAQKKLNDHLNGLQIVNIQNSSSDTRQLFISIYSKKHEANYYLSVGTNKWTWKDAEGVEITVFKNRFIDDHYHMLEISDELKKLIENTLIIKKIELSEKSKMLKVCFKDDSILEAREDITSEDISYYQLTLDQIKSYPSYNLVTRKSSWLEEITNDEVK